MALFTSTKTTPQAPQSAVTTEMVPLEKLKVDESYQRIPGVAKVRNIVNNFNPTMLGAIHASKRADGNYYVVDGWHRCNACRQAGYDKPLNVVVYHGLTVEEEAKLFTGLNDSRTVAAVDKFRARVRQGDDIAATRIDAIVADSGLKIGRHGITAVTALEHVFNGSGIRTRINGDVFYDEILQDTLQVIQEAYGADRKAFRAKMIGGVGYLLNKFPASIDRDRLARVMSEHSPQQIEGSSKAMSFSGAKSDELVAYVLHGFYNRGLRTNKLPVWVLI